MKEIYKLKEIEKEIKANDNLEYNIIYYNNTYCLLLAGSKYYYLQDNFFGKVSVTFSTAKIGAPAVIFPITGTSTSSFSV